MDSLNELKGFSPPKLTEEQKRKAEEWEQEQKRERGEKRIERFLDCGIPPKFIDAKDSENWANKILSGRGLYIVGEVGTGKTYLASAIAKDVMDAGKSVRFMASIEALSHVRSVYGGRGTEDEQFKSLSGCTLLVLDDLGKEKITDWTLQTLFRIINDRYNYERPVIVTTQFSSVELAERLSSGGDEATAKAIISRLFEMCDPLEKGGKDRRLL